MKAINDYVFVEPAEGLNTYYVTGTIRSMGCNVTSVKIGDKVLLGRYQELGEMPNKLLIMKEEDILGVE